MCLKEGRQLVGRLLHVGRDALDRLVDVRLLDVDLFRFRRLDLERLVDEPQFFAVIEYVGVFRLAVVDHVPVTEVQGVLGAL